MNENIANAFRRGLYAAWDLGEVTDREFDEGMSLVSEMVAQS